MRRLRLKISRPRLLAGAGIVVWTGLLLGATFPTWQTSLRHARDLRRGETELAQLNQWSVAGVWLERSVAERGPEVDAHFTRLVPADRQKEQLFLELARVADRSGVSAFDLEEEKQPPGMAADDPGMGPPTDGPPLDGMAADAAPLPDVPVKSYRVEARFVGEFPQVARFLEELHRIPRTLSLNSLTAYSASKGIEVELELDFYVDANQ